MARRTRFPAVTAGSMALLLWLAAPLTAAAQATGYVPDTIEFDGTSGVVFTSHPILTLPDGGTLEFWVAANWPENPGYDPVVLANADDSGVSYQVAVSAERDSLLFQSGDKLGRFDFDFSDGAMHHVGIVDFGDETWALIDGRLAGAVAMSFANLAADTLWVGAGNGNARPFTGAVAALRIWDVPLEPEVLADYALRDVTAADADHPEIQYLVGRSEFRSQDFYITESIVVTDADLQPADGQPGGRP